MRIFRFKGDPMAENQKNDRNRQPTIAPGMDTHNPLDEEPTEEERRRGEVTRVTRLYLDRTPED